MPAPLVRKPAPTSVRNCAKCTKPIPTEKRADAKYCSDHCRYEAFVERQMRK